MPELTLPDKVISESTSAVFLGNAASGSDEWHAMRATGIGGSEVSIICGLNKWQSAYTLWCKKTGRIEESFTGNEATEWGTRLEPVILDKFESEHAVTLHRNVGTWTHPDRPWQIANPDGIFQIGSEFGIVEVKTSQWEDDWKDEKGNPDVPAYYKTQVQWYLNVFGYERAIVVALFHGNTYREFYVLADPVVQAFYVEMASQFRDACESGVAPAWDGSKDTYETVRQLHPLIEDDEVELGWLGVEYFGAEAKFKAAEAEFTKVKSAVLDAMGNAQRGLVENEWTFSRVSRSGGTPYLTLKRR